MAMEIVYDIKEGVEQSLKSILKKNENGTMLSKKRVSISEEHNCIADTYSSIEYDRSRMAPSVLGMRQQIPEMLSIDDSIYGTTPTLSRQQTQSRQEPPSFRVGEWADMFLNMGSSTI